MQRVLESAQLRKLELPMATFSIRPSPPRVVVNCEIRELSEYYLRTKIEPNKTLIGAALKAGESVPGCTLSNQPDQLQIRI
jgi:hypothetical protein